MRRAAPLLLGMALLCTLGARANDLTLEPSAALKCLAPAAVDRLPVVYPAEALERKDGGTVKVELAFSAADRPPSVKVLNDEHVHGSLTAAVTGYVEAFRVPCIKAGDPPVKLRQEYVFIPNDGRKVMASHPRDEADAQYLAYGKCVKHLSGATQPEYASSLRREDIEGSVYLRLRFTKPDAAPEVTVLASSHNKLRRSLLSYVEDLRLPCLDTEPVEWTALYQYRLDGGQRTVLLDLPLGKFLGAVKGPLPSAYFDFNTMGCPFDLRITSMQPYSRNVVGELDNVHPARLPLKDWLAGLTLNLSEKDRLAVLGDTMTVSVPCGKLDL